MRVTQQTGFSIIELMVTISIVSIMSVVAATNFSVGQKKALIDDVANDVLIEIQELENIAISGIEVQGATGPVIPCGYGITEFTETGFNIKAELPDSGEEDQCDGESVFNTGPNNIDHKNGGIGDDSIVIKKFEIPNSNSAKIANLPKDIYFEPPDPTVFIDGKTLADLDNNGISDWPSGDNQYEDIVVCLRNEPCLVGDTYRRVIRISLGGSIELIK